MALGPSVAAANTMLDNLGSAYSWVKLHVGDPGGTGTSNPASNSTRLQATWGTASGGLKSNTNALAWSAVPSSEDYTHFSVWSAASAGNFGFSGPLTANPVNPSDNFTVTAGNLAVSLAVAA